MIAINKIILTTLTLALLQTQPAAAQDQLAACDQNNFAAFVEWFTSLSGDQQRARVNFPLKVASETSGCGDDPCCRRFWDEKFYNVQEFQTWPKLLFDQTGLREAGLVRKIVDLGPDRKQVIECKKEANSAWEKDKSTLVFEFHWDGRCWQLMQLTYPYGIS